MFGFYSQKSVEQNGGYFVYTNAEGKRVNVTCVCKTKEPTSVFGDEVYVGEVVSFVKRQDVYTDIHLLKLMGKKHDRAPDLSLD